MRPALLAVPLGIVLFLAGLWIGHRTAAAVELAPAGLPVTTAETSSHDQEIVRSIAALADQIQALREQIGSRSTASETRVPADGSPSELARIAQMLEDLSERLDSMRGAAGLAPGGLISLRDPEKAPGFASREEMLRDLDEVYSHEPVLAGPVEANAWSQTLYAACKRWQRIHLLWSPQELIERYGRPDDVQDSERGPIFDFVHASPSGRIQGVIFYVRNGGVSTVELHARDR